MPKKKVAKITFVKAAAGVSFATLAAIGGATGNPVIAGLSAVPAAGLASYEAIRDQLGWLKAQEEKNLEIPAPSWWRQQDHAWQNLCTEIEQHLPHIFQTMQSTMQLEQDILTREVVRQIFIDAFEAELLPSVTVLEEKRHLGEFLAPFLFQHIEEVLRPVIERLQQEGVLTDARKIAEHTAQTVHVLEQIHAEIVQANGPLSLSEEEHAALYQRYCQALSTQWNMLDFKGIMYLDMNHPISIPLTDVFVFPDVLLGVPEYETHERDSEYVLLRHPRQRARHVIRQRELLQEVLSKYGRLVILGDPGSGKSTLLRYFLLQLVQERDTSAARFPLMSEKVTHVPFYLPLAAYAEVFLTNAPGTRSLEDFLPVYLRDNYLSEYIDFLQEQFQRGDVIFLFDGLDEIPDTTLRMKVVNHIERFTQAHAANRFIVTSRIVGYKEAPLSTSEYQVYTLADFNEEQINTFTQRWCPAYERWVHGFSDNQYLEDAATKEAQKLFDATQSRPAVKRLAVNPLMLTILALIQRQGIDLPSHRIDLYQRCAETLIDTWVKAKGQSIQFSKNELIRILRPLAFWMHEHAAVGAIPQEELHEQIVHQLVERTLNKHEAHQQADRFLQIVRGKTGILVERGKERYGFLHLTFEEYFTARAIELRKDRETFIKKHLHDPRWREVILLAVGSVGIIHNDEEQVTELIQAIVHANSPYESVLHRDLLFAGLCLADDIGVLPAYEHELIQRTLFLYLTSPHERLRTACSTVLTAWRGTKVAEKAAQLVLPILQQWIATTGAKKTFVPRSSFEKKVATHLEQLTKQQQSKITNHLHFDLMIILAVLQIPSQDWQKTLEALFTSSDVKAKSIAILETGNGNQQALISAFVAGLADPDAEVRRKMVSALQQLTLRQSEWEETELCMLSDAALLALSDTDFSVQRVAKTLLIHIGKIQSSIVAALLASLEKEGVRKHIIIEILGEIGEGHLDVINTLLLALMDKKDQFVKVAAVRVLKKISHDNPYVIDALLTALADSDEDIVDIIIHALGHIYRKKYGLDTSQFAPVLSELAMIADPGVNVLQVTAKALGKLSSDPSEATYRLLASLSSVQKAQKIAITLLGYLGEGHSHVLDTLLTIASDANNPLNIRTEAVSAIGRLKGKETHVVNTLLDILSDTSDLSLKRAAISALGQPGNSQPHVVEILLHILSDEKSDDHIKIAILHALIQLDDSQPHVIDTLFSKLSTSSWSVKKEIIIGLVCLGKDDPHVIEGLLSAFKGQPRLINALLLAASWNIPHTKTAVMDFIEQQGKNQPVIIDALLIALTDSNQSTQEQARDMLIHLYEIYPHRTHDLIAALSRTDLIQEATKEYQLSIFSTITSRTIDILSKINSEHPASVNAVFSALHDDEHGVGRAAVRMLVQLCRKNIDLLERLLCVLSETNWHTRRSAAEAFTQWSEKQGKQSLIDLLRSWSSDKDLPVRYATLWGLGRLGKDQPRVIESLLAALSDPDSLIRGEAARILGTQNKDHPQVIDALLQLLSSDPVEQVRSSAAQSLGALGEKQPRIIDALVQALFNPSSEERVEAYTALKQLGEELPQICDILRSELSSPDPTIRAEAARMLGQIEEEEHLRLIEILLPLLSDGDWRVRAAVVDALGNLSKKQAESSDIIDALLPMLIDYSSAVRQASARAFRTILHENGDRRIIHALLQATYDKDKRVRDAAILALANTQNDNVSIGKRMEELIQLNEQGVGGSNYAFNALQDIVDKASIG